MGCEATYPPHPLFLDGGATRVKTSFTAGRLLNAGHVCGIALSVHRRTEDAFYWSGPWEVSRHLLCCGAALIPACVWIDAALLRDSDRAFLRCVPRLLYHPVFFNNEAVSQLALLSEVWAAPVWEPHVLALGGKRDSLAVKWRKHKLRRYCASCYQSLLFAVL